MIETEEIKNKVCYCGLYCGNCGIYKGRILAMIAADLKELIVIHRFAEWVPEYEKIDFSFNEFQKGLIYFGDKKKGPYCQVPCKEGGGIPFCKIRPCAEEKGVEICFECKKFPCKLFSQFLKKHPEVIEEKKKFKELGMEKWLKLKERDSRRGYALATGKYYTKSKRKK